jgi:hypothetical protein
LKTVQRRGLGDAASRGLSSGGAPGKRTLTGAMQRRATPAVAETEHPRAPEIAAEGFQGSAGPIPHLAQIQASFGHHDVTGIPAFIGGPAADAAGRLGAEAYASDGQVAFGAAPDLHTAAHEAAHVVQQQGGVQLSDGLGHAGDLYEQHADQVADQVLAGRSAEALLDRAPGGGGAGVARKIARPVVQLTGDGPAAGRAQAAAGAQGAAAPADPNAKVARLHLLVDVEVKHLGIKDLQAGNVGHTWISLEYINPAAVPASINAAHRPLLGSPGKYADPMGFWPDVQNHVYYSTNLFKSFVQGWMRHPDRAHQGAEKAVQTWELTQAEVEAVIAYAESKRGAQYSVYFFNCTTFGKEAVQAAGKSAPSMGTAGICFPNAAYDGILERNRRGVGDTSVTDLDSGAENAVHGPDGQGKKG